MGGFRSHESTGRKRTAYSCGPGTRLRRRGADSRRVQRRGGKHSLGSRDGCAGKLRGVGGVAAAHSNSLKAIDLRTKEFLPGPTAAIVTDARFISCAPLLLRCNGQSDTAYGRRIVAQLEIQAGFTGVRNAEVGVQETCGDRGGVRELRIRCN